MMKRILQKKERQHGHILVKHCSKAYKIVLSLFLAFLLLTPDLLGTGGTVAFAAGIPDALPATAVTSSSFTANWSTVDGTSNYYLDVATDSGFINKVIDNQDMGTSTSYSLTSLTSVANYFFRVKAGSSGSFSNVVYVQTPAKNGEYSASSPATSGNEYSISTAAQLKTLADTINAGTTTYNGVYFKLADNIDLSAYSTGSGWAPIGVSTSYCFRGKFDGNGYVVKNMYISRSSTSSVGLFGYLNGDSTEIKNVGVIDCNVTGESRVGAVVGWAYGSGNVVISECFSTGSVSGTRYVGGIVGEAETTSFTVKNCYSTANITGSRNDYNLDEGDAGFGGIVGYVYVPGAKTTNIINCYSTGAIQGPNCVGGIVGGLEIRRDSSMTVTVRNCVALNKSITATFATGTEDTDGLYAGAKDTLRTVNLQNRVVGGIWENPVNSTPVTYTCILNNLYALDTMSVKYHTSTPVSAKTQTATSPDGYSITATDLENNAHNWTNGVVSDPGGTIPAGSATYFDYGDAGNASSVWYYYQDRQVLPVLHRYLDNYQPVLIQPDTLSDTVPYATNVYANSTSQILMKGNTLTAAYTYNANGAGAESGSTYKWLRYDTEKGGTSTAISGASSTTYTLTSSDVGKYISFEVTPASATKTGSAVESGRAGGVAAAPTTANASNNSVSASPVTVAAGSITTLVAAGDRQNASGTVSGDERYIPVSWTSTETGMSGSFTASSGVYTSAYTPASAGSYTVTATFQKQTYDGASWSDTASSTDTKTVEVTVMPADCTVAFNTNGGGAISNQTVSYNNKIAKPADPTRTGYTFGGWHKEAECTNAWSFDTDVVTESITLYAKWTEAPASSQPSISGLSAAYKMYEGGRVALNPQPSGGTWDWDGQYFSAVTGSPITFTALKAGTSTITYTVNGVSYSITISILEAKLPMTGQDSTLLWVLGVTAVICGSAAAIITIILRKKKILL